MEYAEKPCYEVALALVERDGRWLVARRHPHVHLGGMWEFPGGKRERHEAATDAALRELAEECGVSAVVERELPALRCEYADRVVVLLPSVCRWTAGEPQPLGCAETRWVELDDLRQLEQPAVNGELIRALRAMQSNRHPS